MADEFTLTARWMFPVAGPPLEQGLITVVGDRIAAVRPRGTRKADVDLGDVAITPGFVNAHTHLDLTGARGLTPPTPDFVGWLREVIVYRRGRSVEQVAADVQSGIDESVRHGTTLLGDIAVDGGTWDALATAPLRAVVFRELIGMTDERAASAWEGFNWWRSSADATPTCRPGVSPHAPYTVCESLYTLAAHTWLPIAIHLAESRAELELLGDRSGLLVPLLREFNAWCPDQLVDSPERVVQLSATARPALFVHCNYLSPHVPMHQFASVVYCPRTHVAFGHPPHPFREFLKRDVRVALGTDSLASNPDLSVLAEARFIRSEHPEMPGATLLHLATLAGASALDWHGETGSLAPGKSADFAVVALPDRDAADPHDLLFESDLPVISTWVRGGEVYRAE
jgi:cytosine/adenosine deaminase-related metal-dependent hydrolase